MLSQLLLTFEIDRFVLEKALKGVEKDRPIAGHLTYDLIEC